MRATKVIGKPLRPAGEADQSSVLHGGILVAEDRRWRTLGSAGRTILREAGISQAIEIQERRQNARVRRAQDVRQGPEAAADDPRDIRVVSRVLPADYRHEALPERTRLAGSQYRRLHTHLFDDMHQSGYLRRDELRVQKRI